MKSDYFGSLKLSRQANQAPPPNNVATPYVRLEIQTATLYKLVQEGKILGEELRKLDLATKTLVQQAMLESLTG